MARVRGSFAIVVSCLLRDPTPPLMLLPSEPAPPGRPEMVPRIEGVRERVEPPFVCAPVVGASAQWMPIKISTGRVGSRAYDSPPSISLLGDILPLPDVLLSAPTACFAAERVDPPPPDVRYFDLVRENVVSEHVV